MTNGGKRPGAGRKPTRGETKQPLTLGITPTLRAYLDSRCGERSISDFVEDLIRDSRGFREWKARQ